MGTFCNNSSSPPLNPPPVSLNSKKRERKKIFFKRSAADPEEQCQRTEQEDEFGHTGQSLRARTCALGSNLSAGLSPKGVIAANGIKSKHLLWEDTYIQYVINVLLANVNRRRSTQLFVPSTFMI